MSEHQSPNPDQLEGNRDRAVDMAYAKKPYWELMAEAKNLQADDAVELLDQLENQPMEQAGELYDQQNPVTPEAEQSGDFLSSPEAIREFVDKNSVSVTVAARDFETRLHMNNGAHRKPRLKEVGDLMKQFLRDEAPVLNGGDLGKYESINASEVITIAPLHELYDPNSMSGLNSKPGTKTRNEFARRATTLYFMSYQTNGRGSNTQYEFLTPDGRPGAMANYFMIMNAADGEQLQAAIQEKPQLARDLLATIMETQDLDKKGDNMKRVASEPVPDDAWAHPPYEAWKEQNGGVNRIALRTSVDTPPEQCEIIEFN